MTRNLVTAAICLSVLTAACGSSGSSAPATTAPTPTPTPTTTTAPVTTTSGVFTFNFPAGMIATDPDLIKNAITAHASFFQSAFGRTLAQPTTVNGSLTDPGCANGGASAFTGIRVITLCVGNPGWTLHDALNKQKILGHELFLALMFEMRWQGHPNQDAASAHWIDEGAAEYVAWRAVANLGLVSTTAARGCMVAQANAQTSSSQNLSTMETAQGFGIPGSFQLAMLGIDELVASPGAGALITYGTAIANGTPWPDAFQSTFGTSTQAFYSQYPAYRAGLGAGANTCGT